MGTVLFEENPISHFPFSREILATEGGRPALGGIPGQTMSEFARQSFLERGDLQMEMLRARRDSIRDNLEERGYTIDQKRQASRRATEAGCAAILHRQQYPPTAPWAQGVVINANWGNIEARHVTVLAEMLTIHGKASRVLDLGCGNNGQAKLLIEDAAAKRVDSLEMIYADIVPGMLGSLRFILKGSPSDKIHRQFVELDKSSLVKSLEVKGIERGSLDRVIRSGLGLSSRNGIQQIAEMMSSEGQLFVSNSLTRQPLPQELSHYEAFFDDIQVHIGFERYALVCGTPNV